jgi:hypothetical protein
MIEAHTWQNRSSILTRNLSFYKEMFGDVEREEKAIISAKVQDSTLEKKTSPQGSLVPA